MVVEKRKDLHVDELAELRGDRPCQRKRGLFKESGRLVLPNRSNEQKGRTAQLVGPETKFIQVDELAKFGGNRP